MGIARITILWIATTVVAITSGSAQNIVLTEWSESFGALDFDYGYSVIEAIGGDGYVVVGESPGIGDYRILKTDSNGELDWHFTYGGTMDDVAQIIIQANTGGYIVGGTAKSFDGDIENPYGGDDFWLLKINESGEMDWEQSYGGSNTEELKTIAVTSNGDGYLLGGTTLSNGTGIVNGNNGMKDMWIVKIDNDGNVVGTQNYGINFDDDLLHIYTLPNNKYMVVGIEGGINIKMMMINNSLSVEWETTITDFLVTSQAKAVSNDEEGNCFFAYRGGSSDDVVLVKINDTGGIEWEETYGGSSFDIINSIQATEDGGFVMSCQTASMDGNVEAPAGGGEWVFKINADGIIIWSEVFPNNGYFIDMTTIRQTSADEYVLTGYNDATIGDIADGQYSNPGMWVAKLRECFPAVQQNDVVFICEGETYTVGNSMYSQEGTYIDTIRTAFGCDSLIIETQLMIEAPTIDDIEASICIGESYPVGDTTYTQTGIYQDVLQTINGCDSIINLDLTVHPVYEMDIDTAICQGESYPVGDSTYTETGTYEIVLQTVEGCDSIINLDLTVHPIYEMDIDTAICQGESYPVGDSTYTETGTYEIVLQTVEGCDSIINLDLTVHPIYEMDIDTAICQGESYSVGDSTYTETGTYEIVLQTVEGCDSIINLDLTVHPIYEMDIDTAICQGESYSVGDSTYTETGTYEIVLQTVEGCDSIINLDLTVHPVYEMGIETAICDGDSYPVGNSNYTETGSYQDVLQNIEGCDSIINLDLTVHPTFTTNIDTIICPGAQLPETPVFLMSENGCDSTINYIIEQIADVADAGTYPVSCNPEIELDANAAFSNPDITGTWSSQNPEVIFENINNPTSFVYELNNGPNTLMWTLSHPLCPDFSTDQTEVTYYEGEEITAIEDNIAFPFEGLDDNSVIANDIIPDLNNYQVELVQDIDAEVGDLMLNSDGTFTFELNSLSNVIRSPFRYRVFNTVCPEIFSEAEANLLFNLSNNTNTGRPLLFTPNGDGSNDSFVIPELLTAPEKFPNNELIVFNRWGEVVYQKKEYDNSWDGTHYITGKPIPNGTYFYMLFATTAGQLISQEVSLVR